MVQYIPSSKHMCIHTVYFRYKRVFRQVPSTYNIFFTLQSQKEKKHLLVLTLYTYGPHEGKMEGEAQPKSRRGGVNGDSVNDDLKVPSFDTAIINNNNNSKILV